MARGIRITWASSRYIFGRHDGIRVRIEATAACEMTNCIFAYRMLPVDPNSGEDAGFFSHICSPADLEEYPANAPIPCHRPEWFRKTFVDVLVRSVAEAEEFIAAVIDDVRRLKRTLDIMDTVIPGGSLTIGEACPEEPSEASSDSSAGSEDSASLGSPESLTAEPTLIRDTGAGRDWDGQTVLLYPGTASKLLLLQGFDLSSLPANCEIGGIQIEVPIRFVEDTGGFAQQPQLSFFSLHHPEQGVIENRGPLDITGPSFDSLVQGDDSDLWNENWTASLLKRGEFGIALVATMPIEMEAEIGTVTIEVDTPTLTVFFRERFE